jgi:hypothetical protein
VIGREARPVKVDLAFLLLRIIVEHRFALALLFEGPLLCLLFEQKMFSPGLYLMIKL